ncbi:YneF family protein, partial [Candidatus Phytoplasma gossypii]|uniref:YneF family protein n=1 Tax=Candidatus Phytoplasma gossypii TaxID=2982629 RepID=UPI003B969A0C
MTWFETILFLSGLFIGILVGALVMFFGIKIYLEKNPPINKKQIKEMFKQMGRSPSEKQIQQIMLAMNKNCITKFKLFIFYICFFISISILIQEQIISYTYFVLRGSKKFLVKFKNIYIQIPSLICFRSFKKTISSYEFIYSV